MLLFLVALLFQLWRVLRRYLRRQLVESDAVLVTGCDSGFGLRIVKALVEKTEAAVFAGYVTQEGSRALASLGPRVHPVPLDVTKDAEVQDAFAEVASSGKSLRGVVNNAGLGAYGWCEAVSMERYEQNLRINLLGAIRVTKAALPLLRRSRGRLVTMGSMSGRCPSAFGSAYIPTKAALASFQDCVRQEVYRFGVRCSLVEPGFFATGMLHRAATLGEHASARTETQAEDALEGYEPFSSKMKRCEGSVLQCERLNGGERGVDRVTDAVLDGLVARFPNAYYLVGVDANILGRLAPLIPSWVMDLAQTYVV